jgi:hypothetical protein
MRNRYIAVLCAALCALPVLQAVAQGTEMSVEESYLQEAIDLQVIKEYAKTSSREEKVFALEYVGGQIEAGKVNDMMRGILEDMAMDGVLNKVRENGRVVNNFPDIRLETVKLLGKISTKESKDSLIRVCNLENEPAVLTEAINGLANIGINDNDDVIRAIRLVFYNFDSYTPPDMRLASAILDACDVFAQKGSTDSYIVSMIMRIAVNQNYIHPVRQRARALLDKLIKSSSS